MTVFVLLAICGLVFLILARPFRQAPPPDAGAAPAPGTRTSSAGERETGAPAAAAASPSRAAAGSPEALLPEDRTHLLDEKDRLFQALADLRFDFEAGKLSPADFELEDGRLRARAARVLRELEG